jgi:hypothetical protein
MLRNGKVIEFRWHANSNNLSLLAIYLSIAIYSEAYINLATVGGGAVTTVLTKVRIFCDMTPCWLATTCLMKRRHTQQI